MNPDVELSHIMRNQVVKLRCYIPFIVFKLSIEYNHIFHGLVIGTDGRKLPFPYGKDTLLIGSEERYGVLYKIPDFSSRTRCLSVTAALV